jgi:Rrf2 family protein
MSIKSSRFAVAVHILALLTIEGKVEATTSAYLGRSANTNPVVIRRILAQLGQAGLVAAHPGVGGGVRLARPPEQITLFDVYQAVGEGEFFSLGSRQPNPYCICARQIGPVLTEVFQQAKAAVEQTLAKTTLAQIAQEIEARDAAFCSMLGS